MSAVDKLTEALLDAFTVPDHEITVGWYDGYILTVKDIEVLARSVAEELAKRDDLVVVELPEPHPIRVTSINMAPTPLYDRQGELQDDDDTPVIEVRFNDIPQPGRLFDRPELAAALLAAERDEQRESKES